MSRFQTWLVSEQGLRFRGIIMPAGDNVPANSFVDVRLLLRVRPDEPITNGSVIIDPMGRHLLVGAHDSSLDQNFRVSRTHRLFIMTKQVLWQRSANVTDPITGLSARSTLATQGTIWVAIELLGQMDPDRGTHIDAEKHHVITGSPIQLHDQVDGLLVKRITQVFGITVAEVE